MAELKRVGDELVLTLSAAEHAESLHANIRVPLAGAAYSELLVGLDDPEAVRATIGDFS